MIAQITASGSISAAWVLVILASLVGFLVIYILNGIRNDIKSMVQRQNDQEKNITITAERADYAHERIDEMKDLLLQKTKP